MATEGENLICKIRGSNWRGRLDEARDFLIKHFLNKFIFSRLFCKDLMFYEQFSIYIKMERKNTEISHVPPAPT